MVQIKDQFHQMGINIMGILLHHQKNSSLFGGGGRRGGFVFFFFLGKMLSVVCVE
jgi:hypothetical protein